MVPDAGSCAFSVRFLGNRLSQGRWEEKSESMSVSVSDVGFLFLLSCKYLFVMIAAERE